MTNFIRGERRHQQHCATSSSRFDEDEPSMSPSMSIRAEDTLSNSEGPLLYNKKREKDLDQIRREVQASMSQVNAWRNERKERLWNEKKKQKEEKSIWSIWTITSLLLSIGFCNLLVNLAIIVVLRISQGMEALQVIPAERLVKFHGTTDLDHVALQNGVCEGFGDEPIELDGDEADVHIQVANSNKQHQRTGWSYLKVLRNGSLLSRADSFKVTDSKSGRTIFSTASPEFRKLEGAKNIQVSVAETHRIAAPKNSDLNIESDKTISVYGAEGTAFDSKDLLWSASDDMLVHSRTGDIILEARDELSLNVSSLLSCKYPEHTNKTPKSYKVYVCMPEGRVFLVPAHKSNVKINCAKIAQSSHNEYCDL